MLQRMLNSGIADEKGMGCESPAITSRCMRRMFLCPPVKAGHWETEKAEHKNSGLLPYKARVRIPALMLFRTCFFA